MKRARLAAVLFSLAACGSDTTPTGADLCSKAQTVSNNVTQKVSACVPAAGTGIPTGQTCTTALASCNSNDQVVLNQILDCFNGLPTLTASQCTTSAATDWVNQANACTSAHVSSLSTACQNATINSGGGSSSFTAAAGTCTASQGATTVACGEFAQGSALNISTVCTVACSYISGSSSTSCSSSSTGQCSATGRTGQCVTSYAGFSARITYYGTAATGQSYCQQIGGTWTAG